MGAMAGVINKLFDRSTGNTNYNTPTKSVRLTDIIYGSRTSQDRSVLHSQQVPYDFFGLELPDPSQAHNKTRETLTISDILSGTQSKGRQPS